MKYPKDEYKWMYNTRVWKAGRHVFLQHNPLCEICRGAGRVTPSTVVNHRKAHRGCWTLFKDTTNWQALCKPCHDSEGQSIDKRGHSNRIGIDGWPVDDKHPFNKM
jgi:5-methylcytosine-specific restriction endonuclease McrA